MKNSAKFVASLLAVFAIALMASSAQAITYQVHQSFNGNVTLVGSVDVALGNYTIMNGGATPFTDVLLTLTVNGTPFQLDHADASIIAGTGRFIIDATANSLMFGTAGGSNGNPSDLQFFDSTNTNRYAIGSDGIPDFQGAYTTSGYVLDSNISFPFLFGMASTSVPETGSTLGMLGLVALGILAVSRRRTKSVESC